MALDIENGECLFSLNGGWAAPLGLAFSNLREKSRDLLKPQDAANESDLLGFIPAVSFDAGFHFSLNFGDRPFRYSPPPSKSPDPFDRFRSVRHYVRERISALVKLKSGSGFGTMKATTGNSLMSIVEEPVTLSLLFMIFLIHL